MTQLCIAITVLSHEQALSDAAQAGERGADLVEYRVDNFTDLDDVRFLVEKSPLPCIVTCRPTWEGGQCDLPDQERIPVLESASVSGASYIDVELVAYQRSANLRQKVHFNAGAAIDKTAPRENRQGLIVSSHDFAGRPARLNNIIADLGRTGADVLKIVWTARSIRDNLEAFEILRNQQKPTIALCMGDAGLISRILAPKFKGFLTFAALRPEGRGPAIPSVPGATAPGQPSPEDLLNIYRFRDIKPSTKVYGVVGHPIAHSLSPHIHNENFGAQGDDAVYVPFLVAPGYESFKAFMETFARDEHFDLAGLSITLPHKENAYRYLQDVGGEISAVAESVKALNTIRVSRSRAGEVTFAGTSTDHGAIAHCVRKGLPAAGRTIGPVAEGDPDRDASLKSIRVAIIGAGGTGRTATAILSSLGADITVYNRTADRAEQLAGEFPRTASAHLSDLPNARADVFINATTQGMYPNSDVSAWGETMPAINQSTVVFDTIYTPLTTRFLKQAQDAGAVTVPGLEMFAHQAAAQYTFWTGRPVTADRFRTRAQAELRQRGSAE